MLWFSWVHERGPKGPDYLQPLKVQHSGYNRVRVKLIETLSRAGLAVQDGGPPPDGAVQIAHAPLYREPRNLSIWERQAERAIIYTTFESSILPAYWVEAANTFDAVWTTSFWNKRVFEQCGVTVPIHVIHHGVDPGAFPIMRRPATREHFTFLWQGMSIGSLRNLRWEEPVEPEGVSETSLFGDEGSESDWYMAVGEDPHSPAALRARQARRAVGDRKQALLAREAFLRLRKGRWLGPDARLVLKWTTIFNRRWQYANWPLDGTQISTFGTRHMSDDEIRAMLFNADCSVNPFRCEGFGMIPLEHMATGLPTIYTRFSGPEDYAVTAGRELGWPLDYELGDSWWTTKTRAALEELRRRKPLTAELSAGGQTIQYDRPTATREEAELMRAMENQNTFGQDAHPSLDHLMDLMVDRYTHPRESLEKAVEDARYVHAHWSWERALHQVLASLSDLGWYDAAEWASKAAEERMSSVVFEDWHRLGVGV